MHDELANDALTDAGQVDGTPPAPAGQVDSSVSIQEAASALGISERTVRRRIKDGILIAYKLPTTQGYQWRVKVDGSPDNLAGVSTRQSIKVDRTPVQSPGTTADQVDTSAMLAALELADQLRRDNAALASRNEQLAGQLGFLQSEIQQRDRQIALLMAPKDEPAEETPAALERVSWWKRIFGG